MAIKETRGYIVVREGKEETPQKLWTPVVGSPLFLGIRNDNLGEVTIFATKEDAEICIKEYEIQEPASKLAVRFVIMQLIWGDQ